MDNCRLIDSPVGGAAHPIVFFYDSGYNVGYLTFFKTMIT